MVQHEEVRTEEYMRAVKDMCYHTKTAVRTPVVVTESFEFKVGLHQGSVLSPFLFAMILDRLTEDIRQELPWNMLFADDIVLCCKSRDEVEKALKQWREALEERGLRVSRVKTEYMHVNGEQEGTIRLAGTDVKKVQEFKYLGSTVQQNDDSDREVKKRTQAGWHNWRKVSGVVCDRKIHPKVKGKVYRTVVRPATTYGLETAGLRKRQEAGMEVVELRMLRFSLGVTRKDRIENRYIRGTAHVRRLGEKLREGRLRWYVQVQRRDAGYVGKKVMDMDLPGTRRRGRLIRRNGYSEGRCESCRSRGGRLRPWEMEKDDPLWRLLKGEAERQRRKKKTLCGLIFLSVCVCDASTIHNDVRAMT